MKKTIKEIASLIPRKYTEFSFNKSDSGGSINHSKLLVIYLNKPLNQLQLAYTLEHQLGYPKAEKMGGYAEANKDNSYEFNLWTPEPKDISIYYKLTKTLYGKEDLKYTNLKRVVVIDYHGDSVDIDVVFDTEDKAEMDHLFTEILSFRKSYENKLDEINNDKEMQELFDLLDLEDKQQLISELIVTE